MNPKVLFVVSSDPRVSHRPAEAVRIAAGVGAWEMADIKIYLHGAAVLLLGEGRLVDEDGVRRHLGMLAESRRPIYVEAGNSFLGEVKGDRHEELLGRQLAVLAGESNYLVHF
jgi:hypothetical protein